MTRGQVEKLMQADGGLSAPFRYERYILVSPKCSEKGEVLKLNLSLKPAGMSDAVYYLGKWAPPKQSKNDVVMRVSPPYMELPISD